MFSYIWPIALVVICNTVYQICTKSVPGNMNPLASLTITYLVAAATSTVLYFLLNRGGNLLEELTRTNWAPAVLGVVIVGLETGFIYAYKAGWPVSTASTVQSCFLAVVLLLMGFFLYHESLNASKIIGMVICLVGLYFVNK
ncbi:MAG: EamA family transporter [Clostridiales bacterium]|nr:EamA family transporter [Candidatus Cacconaster stercorequi]